MKNDFIIPAFEIKNWFSAGVETIFTVIETGCHLIEKYLWIFSNVKKNSSSLIIYYFMFIKKSLLFKLKLLTGYHYG